MLSPRNAERAQALAERHATVTVAADNQAVIDAADVVVLAVRPQDRAVLGELRFNQRPVVSLLAGVTHAELAPLVAPAREIRRAIPLPDVARRTGVTPIQPDDSAAPPLRRALLGERAHALGEVLGAERGLAQRVAARPHSAGSSGAASSASQHALVAAHRERRQGRRSRRPARRRARPRRRVDDLVDEPPASAPRPRSPAAR